MGRSDNVTSESDADVAEFIEAIPDPRRREDARVLLALMQRATGQAARMWGRSIIGFGRYHFRYDSGREGDMCAASFSPRKAATTVYFVDGVEDHSEDLALLGPHTTGVSCVYLKRVSDVDLEVLERMVRHSYATLTAGTFTVRLS